MKSVIIAVKIIRVINENALTLITVKLGTFENKWVLFGSHIILSSKIELTFIQRLLSDNSDLNNKQLAEVLERELTDNGKLKSPPEVIFRDSWSKSIFPKLREEGYQGENKWQKARKWLINTKYPIWKDKQVSSLNLLGSWRCLRDKAENRRGINPIILQQPPLSELAIGGWEKKENPIKQIPLNSLIHYQIQLPQGGYLLLLEKFSNSADVYCLCPSSVSPSFEFDTGEVILPQKTKHYSKDHFTVEGSIGIEEVLAVISPVKPKLDWLPKLQDKPLSLTEKHLQSLITMVNMQ